MSRAFNEEYLTALRERQSYDHHEGPIQKADIDKGDIVIMKGDKHRMTWELAEVTELLPGKDDQVRAVKLRTATGETSRPICLLYPLVKCHELRPEKQVEQDGPEQETEDHKKEDGPENGQDEPEKNQDEHENDRDEQAEETTVSSSDREKVDSSRRPKRTAAKEAEKKILAMQQYI